MCAHMCAWLPWTLEEDVGSPGLGVADRCEPRNESPLEEQLVFLPLSHLPSPAISIFNNINQCSTP